ncbi:hypothetical protein [Microbacterium enclense]|uniref:Uncharacterized protein n=1 Tax=Microbacterium enclense TaxID=993073 RepID=A0A1G6GLX4_9MICO|nr:hypothetical protein [Microbacterium enclense]SDB82934.1 hypothetical protein SAMN05216418_0413 [Microbacterium enclense]
MVNPASDPEVARDTAPTDLSSVELSPPTTPLTVAWAVGDGTDVWRSSTTAVFTE